MSKILIIDDDPHVREGLVALLESEGHTVTEAETSATGRARLFDGTPEFDLVLLDLWLPDESGLHILRDIRRSLSDLPVIVMSGGGPGRSLEQAIAIADTSGAATVLIKPFRNEELLAALKRILDSV